MTTDAEERLLKVLESIDGTLKHIEQSLVGNKYNPTPEELFKKVHEDYMKDDAPSAFTY